MSTVIERLKAQIDRNTQQIKDSKGVPVLLNRLALEAITMMAEERVLLYAKLDELEKKVRHLEGEWPGGR